MSVKETKSLVKTFPQRKLHSNASAVNSSKHRIRWYNLANITLRLIRPEIIERKKTFPSSSYEASIILIPKSEKDTLK